MIIDMHTHLDCITDEKYLASDEKIRKGMEEIELRETNHMVSFFSFGTPEEWNFMQELEKPCYKTGKKPYLKSFGIHPWYSDRFESEHYMEYFKSCDAVGEIGMDSVWCDIPFTIQKKALEDQLQIAANLHKPVILHTKGQEQEIYELVKDFPGKICVHWYSGDVETFEKYLELGCYFTLGPDLGHKYKNMSLWGQSVDFFKGDTAADKAAQNQIDKASARLYKYMVHSVPVNRLFLETDGISAVAWAYGVEQLPIEALVGILRDNLGWLAYAKGYTVSQMETQMESNLAEFLK